MITFTIKIFGDIDSYDNNRPIIESKYLLGVKRISDRNITPMECEQFISITKNICASELTAEECQVLAKFSIDTGNKKYIVYSIVVDDNDIMIALDEEFVDDMYWLKYCYLVG